VLLSHQGEKKQKTKQTNKKTPKYPKFKCSTVSVNLSA
jgi:hypothetical protein